MTSQFNMSVCFYGGTDHFLGEQRAEGVHFIRALRGPVQQVTDGNGPAHGHHANHCRTGQTIHHSINNIYYKYLLFSFNIFIEFNSFKTNQLGLHRLNQWFSSHHAPPHKIFQHIVSKIR